MKQGQEKKQVVTNKVLLKIRGVVTEAKSWAARHFAIYAIHKAPYRYSLDVKFLFELEWSHMRCELERKGVQVPKSGGPLCAVWAEDKYIGDDEGLYKFLQADGYIQRKYLHNIIDLRVMISTNPLDYCPRNINRAYVFFDVSVDDKIIGRMLFELFTDKMPYSCERFLKECRRYNGCPIHRIAQGGWFESGQFAEEDPPLREKRPPGLSNCRKGMVSLVNMGKTNCKSSQFLVTFESATFLDPYQCPIGVLLEGEDILQAIDNIETHYDSPLKKVNLKNVTILYAPNYFIENNHLLVAKCVAKPPKIWIEEEELMGKTPTEDEIKTYRFELYPKFVHSFSDIEDKLNRIRLKLYQENRKLQELIDGTGFKTIVKSILEKERRKGEEKVFQLDDLEELEREKWYNLLVDADSDFDVFYKPSDVPHLCSKLEDEWLQKSSILENPTIIGLIKQLEKNELFKVLDLSKRIIEQSINEAVHSGSHELYIPAPTITDYSKPLGDDIDKLPKSMQDLLIDQVCKLSNNEIDLFRSTLRHILETVSQVKLDDSSSISGDLIVLTNVTKSMLSIQSLDEKQITQRKKSIIKGVQTLTKKMMKTYLKAKSDPVTYRPKEVPFIYKTPSF